MREVVNRVVPLIMVALAIWQVATHGLPSLDSSVLGPADGPRAVVTITESSNATPKRDALLAQLQNDTPWGSSVYRAYEANHAAAAPFTKAYPGDSLHIGVLTPEGKLKQILYSGPLPLSKQEVLALWKQYGGQ